VLPIEAAEEKFGRTREALLTQGILVTSDRMAELMIHAAGPGIHGRRIPVPPDSAMAAGRELGAFVNDGRWLVQCDACYSAQLASRADHRFYCIECLNGCVQGNWRPVRWPADAAAIETALAARPRRDLQNWVWGQTADDLAAANAKHGVTP